MIQLEEDSKQIFEEHLDQTDWKKIAHKIKKQDNKSYRKKTIKIKELKRTIDLHGHTVGEARRNIDSVIDQMIASEINVLSLKIITGKGLHSGERGAVLAKEIPLHIQTKWAKRILSIEESPAELIINEKLIRGDFTVTLNVEKQGK